MKKRTSIIVKVGIGVVVVGLAGLLIKNYIGGKVKQVSIPSSSMYTEVSAQRIDLLTYSRGSGLFSSFHTADIKVEETSKILQQYVADGEAVTSNQAIFLVNNGYESSYVKTPINGLFFEKQGENTATSYQVYDTSDTGVMIQVSEENVAKLALGQSAKVLFSAVDKELDGSVTYISKVADAGNFAVRVSVPYSEDLRFGYNGSVKIVTASKEQALCVPYNAVLSEGDKTYVIKAKHKKELNETFTITDKMKTYIKTGASDSDYVEVLEGLQDDEKILIGNTY